MLNAHHQNPLDYPVSNTFNQPTQGNSSGGNQELQDIDKLLSKIKKSNNMPTKGIEKMFEK